MYPYACQAQALCHHTALPLLLLHLLLHFALAAITLILHAVPAFSTAAL